MPLPILRIGLINRVRRVRIAIREPSPTSEDGGLKNADSDCGLWALSKERYRRDQRFSNVHSLTLRNPPHDAPHDIGAMRVLEDILAPLRTPAHRSGESNHS
jgi:hypothetical protein